MARKTKAIYKKGDTVIIRVGLHQEQRTVEIEQEPNWNGFTWMYDFIGETIRLGEMYLRRPKPEDTTAPTPAAAPEPTAPVVIPVIGHRTPQIRDGVTFVFFKEDTQGNPIYYPEADIKVLEDHDITEEEIGNWQGDSDPFESLKLLTEIANGGYDIKQFRYDVISYDDELLTGRSLVIFPNGIEILK